MYRIGEFAKLSGISEKTLRFYHETDVFSPSVVNSRTRYRYYGAQQLSEAALILIMRQLGVSLSEIKNFSRELKAAPSRRRYLERTKSELQRALEEKSRALAWVEAELRWLEQAKSAPPVVLKRSRSMPIASVRSTLSGYDDLLRLEEQVLANIPSQSCGSVRGALWHRCAETGSVDGEYFVSVKGPIRKGDRVEVKTLPECPVAAAYCATDDASALATFSLIQRWMEVHGYRLTGPKREFYHADLIEVQFPVDHSLAIYE